MANIFLLEEKSRYPDRWKPVFILIIAAVFILAAYFGFLNLSSNIPHRTPFSSIQVYETNNHIWYNHGTGDLDGLIIERDLQQAIHEWRFKQRYWFGLDRI